MEETIKKKYVYMYIWITLISAVQKFILGGTKT